MEYKFDDGDKVMYSDGSYFKRIEGKWVPHQSNHTKSPYFFSDDKVIEWLNNDSGNLKLKLVKNMNISYTKTWVRYNSTYYHFTQGLWQGYTDNLEILDGIKLTHKEMMDKLIKTDARFCNQPKGFGLMTLDQIFTKHGFGVIIRPEGGVDWILTAKTRDGRYIGEQYDNVGKFAEIMNTKVWKVC